MQRGNLLLLSLMKDEWVPLATVGGVCLLIALLGALTAIGIARRGHRQISEVITAGHRQAVLLAREDERRDAYTAALEYADGARLEYGKVGRGENAEFLPPDIDRSAPLLAGVSAHGGPEASRRLSDVLMHIPTTNYYAARLSRAPRDETREQEFVAALLRFEELYESFATYAHADLATPLEMPVD
jgi:hypothetical protein